MPVPPGKQRVLLAVLLLHANRVVPGDELTDALWGWHPPPSARPALRNYVKRLRKVLGDAAHDLIRSVPGGYLIRTAPGDVDLARFEELERASRAATAAGDLNRAADQLRAALSLWRGEPFADVRSEWLVVRELPRLIELRLRALETLVDLDLRLGVRADPIAELRSLIGVHPLREGLHRLLMLALCKDGRRGEALAAYQFARTVLIAELGAEPGPELQHLHQQILAEEPGLSAPAPRAPGMPVPRQLPPGVRQFAGRTAELAALREMTADGCPVIAVTGAAGVGKTAIALRLAHEIAGRFPDGQLYADLRGYDRDQPVPPGDVLAGFLRAFGVRRRGIPVSQAERAARFRSLLAGQRVLVVLDNARSADQVQPMLPGTPGSAVVVTSRDSLAGLTIRHGAQRLVLDLPRLEEAVELLGLLIGDRVAADPAAAWTLAAQCGRLPLALCLVAELAALRPAAPIAILARELAGRHGRLQLLDACGDPGTALRTAFSWSYQHLDHDAARAFRLLGLLPDGDVEPYAAAVMTGKTVAEARRVLTVLARAHLIQPAGPARYRMDGLLRAYAAELLEGNQLR